MSSNIIYFPRMNQSYSSDPWNINACATWLRHTGAKESYISLIDIARGGSFPIKRGDRFFFEELEPEKTMSHLFGIYYEEYYFDNVKSLFESTLRNLKMRIVAPILFIKGNVFGMPELSGIAAVSCGFQREKNCPIAINPLNGEYFDVSSDMYAEFQHQTKMVMYNVPGMSKINQLDEESIAVKAISIYLRRFYCFEITKINDAFGLKAWNPECMHLEDKKAFLSHVQLQLNWLENTKKYVHLLNNVEQEQFNSVLGYYQKAMEEI